jgi:hypothetical protein
MNTKITSVVSAFLICQTQGFTMAAPPPPDVAKTVTFIFLADDKGNPRIQNDSPVANGTGFFVILENENGPGGYGYLVTAKHVLKDEKGDYFKRVFIRINDKKQGSGLIPIDLVSTGEKQNVFIHSESTVDIAVTPGWPDQNVFDFLAVPTALIKSKEDFKKSTIRPGSDVFFAGLFAPHYGGKKTLQYSGSAE